MMRAVVEPKEEGSVDEEEKVSSSVAGAVQSAEKAFKDATPAVETAAPKAAMQAMMCVLLFAFRFVFSSSRVLIKERERESGALLVFFSINQFFW